MAPNSKRVIDVWAHLGDQRDQVLARARQKVGGRRVRIQGAGPVQVGRGTTLTVRARIAGLKVTPAHQPILWVGDIGNANFRVTVPPDAANGSHEGTATIRMDGISVAQVLFEIKIAEQADAVPQLQGRERRYRKAFASYASEDRYDVLGRLQGLQKGLPRLRLIVDIMSLRSGEHWQTRLQEEIVSSDVLYLFWSEAASRSKWVDWEWRCALRERGINFIDPCPLVPPTQVPPPKELADELHFNDWVLAYMPYGTSA